MTGMRAIHGVWLSVLLTAGAMAPGCDRDQGVSLLAEAGPEAEAQDAFNAYRTALMRRAATGEGLSFKVHQLKDGTKQLCAHIDKSESAQEILASYGSNDDSPLTVRAVEACPL